MVVVLVVVTRVFSSILITVVNAFVTSCLMGIAGIYPQAQFPKTRRPHTNTHTMDTAPRAMKTKKTFRVVKTKIKGKTPDATRDNTSGGEKTRVATATKLFPTPVKRTAESDTQESTVITPSQAKKRATGGTTFDSPMLAGADGGATPKQMPASPKTVTPGGKEPPALAEPACPVDKKKKKGHNLATPKATVQSVAAPEDKAQAGEQKVSKKAKKKVIKIVK